MSRYDAIVVGASFAGLAVASRLRGNILLVDRKDIGSGQTSACGTLLNVAEALHCTDSVLQVYHRGFIHTPTRTIQYELPYPLCTLDYPTFCQRLAQRSQADFLKANVQALRNGRVVTDKGEFEATCLIDASGWRAVLASSIDADFVDTSALSFGLDTTVPLRGTGLYFWVDRSLVSRGVGWIFPCGDHSRAGIGSYEGTSGVKRGLKELSLRLGAEVTGSHGGFFPWKLRQPTVGRTFLAGDAAGQCLPLTGEGIRPALYFGIRCGDIVQQVIDGQISIDEGLGRYRAEVMNHRLVYSLMEMLQRKLIRLPMPWLTAVMRFLSFGPIFRGVMGEYERRASLDPTITPR